MTSRLPRVEFDHAFYHITARGNNRQNIFLEEKDFTRFLFELVRVVREYDWRCYAYCLMTNHYHLTIQTIQPNLSLGMRTLHMRYSKYFREQHVFTGSLFENRYDSSMISDDAYVLEAIRYDLINPVRANLVKHPEDWRWSSYAETAGFEKPSEWVDVAWVRSMFDDETLPAKRFIDFISMGIN